ncbi:hypothetical protein Acr_15g0016040 [Actinidia rufa]|uniref:Uncharacterized protein n=1 Tax=Actinidia rufa TaxID=165716 RepID=A0A7J0FWE3_9ERIC|nr:hypothetical protein Acr_15g0016040 [Actinidia rufa]
MIDKNFFKDRLLFSSVSSVRQVSSAPDKSNDVKYKNNYQKSSNKFSNGVSNGKTRFHGMSVEDVAATRIQTAFRAYVQTSFNYVELSPFMEQGYRLRLELADFLWWSGVAAVKQWRRFLQGYIRGKKQQLSGSGLWHMLSPISGGQTQVQASGLLSSAKLTGVGVGWNAGLLLDRGKAEFPFNRAPRNRHLGLASKAGKNMSTPTMKAPVSSLKTISPNGKGPTRPRKLTYPAAEKPNSQGNIKTEDANIERGEVMS